MSIYGFSNRKYEEYAQYKAFREQHPEIDWDADAMFTGYETETVDTVPVALRTWR